ncbi:MAG: CotH kinase family protein [Clostridia bacterium]|nr:CotH kinase family protein [Clostridia bacterium]
MKKHSFISLLCLLLAVLCLLPACTKGSKGTTGQESEEASSPSKEPSQSIAESSVGEESKESESSKKPVPNSPTPTPDSPSKEPSEDRPSDEPVTEEKISFLKEKISLKKGSEYTVSASTSPADAALSAFTWHTSDSSIATVENGKVKALKTGSVLIAAMSADGESYDYLVIDVVNNETDVTSLSFESASFSLAVGTQKPLPIVYEPSSVPLENITFTVADPTILTVNEQGVITALKLGSTTVTATSIGGTSAELTVTVTDIVNKVTSIKLEKDAYELEAGEALTLNATVLPENADNKKLIYKSEDANIVSVSADGVINAIRTGKTTITVLSHDGKVSASCTVTVNAGDDPMDDIDTSSALYDPDQTGYNGGLRLKSTGEILFSPTLEEFRFYLEITGKEYSDYMGYIRFTVLPVEGQTEFIFHSITAEPKKSKGDWVDFFLSGGESDTGFCPTADVYYKVELILVEKATGKAAFRSEFAEMQANNDIKGSKYYNPTTQGGQVIVGPTIPSYTLTYKAVGGGVIFGLTTQTVKQGTSAATVFAVAKPGFQFTGWSDGKTDAARTDYPYASADLSAYFSGSGESSIPVLNIITGSGQPITSKTYEPATLTVTGMTDPRFNITASLQIRGRGNSSWQGSAPQDQYNSKNSYRIKLDEKEHFLGIGDSKNKDWVLNSNKFDLSGLRNVLVWTLAEKMGTMTYVPDYCWVQLYVNGQYRGMYLVTELIEDANDRVELDKTVTKSEDKGYLLEIDFRGNYEDTPYFYIDGYGPNPKSDLHGAREFVVKNDCTADDLAYIEDYIKKCHAAILSGDRTKIDSLIDISSLIDMYLLEELSKDVDVGAASFFLHKKEGGKLYFTAPWDFDFGFGTYGPAVSTYGLVSEYDDGSPWFAALVEQEWFRKEVVARMEEIQPAFEATMEAIKAYGESLEGAADMNAMHWDMYGNNFHQYVSSQVSSRLYSYPEHIEFLVEWSTERWGEIYYIFTEW